MRSGVPFGWLLDHHGIQFFRTPSATVAADGVNAIFGHAATRHTRPKQPIKYTGQRWVIRRKAEVVAAVRGGLLSLEEACNRYTLTVDEFLSWQYSIDQHGLAGLRSTRTQQYRQK